MYGKNQFNISATKTIHLKMSISIEEHIIQILKRTRETQNFCIRCSVECLRSKWSGGAAAESWTASFGSLPASYFGVAERRPFAVRGFFFMASH